MSQNTKMCFGKKNCTFTGHAHVACFTREKIIVKWKLSVQMGTSFHNQMVKKLDRKNGIYRREDQSHGHFQQVEYLFYQNCT